MAFIKYCQKCGVPIFGFFKKENLCSYCKQFRDIEKSVEMRLKNYHILQKKHTEDLLDTMNKIKEIQKNTKHKGQKYENKGK